MLKNPHGVLSRRERQIMDIVYRLGRASVAAVLAEMHDPPSYSTARTLMSVLEAKGHLRHECDGPRYVFLPTVSRAQARRTALAQVVRVFFDGVPAAAASALLDSSDIPDAALDDLE